MPGGAELAVYPGGGDFGQEELIHVPPHVAVPELGHLVVNFVQSGDHLVQHQGGGYLENGVVHIPGVGALPIPVKVFDEGEYLLLHHGMHPFSGEVPEHRPLELAARNRLCSDRHLPSENTRVGQAQHGALPGFQAVCVVQVPDEHEVGHLLHHVQGVGNAAGPENLPKGVDFVFQFAGNHNVSLSLYQL